MVKNPFKKKVKDTEEATTGQTLETKTKKKEEKDNTPLAEYIKAYQTYRGTFTPADFAGLRPDSEICTLLFAVFCELKKLNENKDNNSDT